MPIYPQNSVWCNTGMYCVDGVAPDVSITWNAEQDTFTLKFSTSVGGSGSYYIVLTPEQFTQVWGDLTIHMMAAMGERDEHLSERTQPMEAHA